MQFVYVPTSTVQSVYSSVTHKSRNSSIELQNVAGRLSNKTLEKKRDVVSSSSDSDDTVERKILKLNRSIQSSNEMFDEMEVQNVSIDSTENKLNVESLKMINKISKSKSDSSDDMFSSDSDDSSDDSTDSNEKIVIHRYNEINLQDKMFIENNDDNGEKKSDNKYLRPKTVVIEAEDDSPNQKSIKTDYKNYGDNESEDDSSSDVDSNEEIVVKNYEQKEQLINQNHMENFQNPKVFFQKKNTSEEKQKNKMKQRKNDVTWSNADFDSFMENSSNTAVVTNNNNINKIDANNNVLSGVTRKVSRHNRFSNVRNNSLSNSIIMNQHSMDDVFNSDNNKNNLSSTLKVLSFINSDSSGESVSLKKAIKNILESSSSSSIESESGNSNSSQVDSEDK